jgi:predicted nucleotidyltransferase
MYGFGAYHPPHSLSDFGVLLQAMNSSAPAGLFATIPDPDHLGFWQDRKLSPVAVVRFLRFTKADVARIALVSRASVRFDHKIPASVLERLAQIAVLCGRVAKHFDGDASKTLVWFMTGNPLLGDMSPRDMILRGRYEALRRFVMQALERDAAEQLAGSSGLGDKDPGTAPGDLPPLILAHQAAISALCLRYGVRQLALSGARAGLVSSGEVSSGEDSGQDSGQDSGDIELVVEFGPPGEPSVARQYVDFKRGLGQLLGRSIDLLELSAMQDCRLKRLIQRTRLRIYATAA